MSSLFEPIELLLSLIRYPSVSSTSNLEINQAVADVLRALDFDVQFQEFNDPHGVGKSNLIAHRGDGPGGVAYFCHTDVVPAADWSGCGSAFAPCVVDDRIYGRGSCDMKGSLVAMLTAISRLDRSQSRAPISVVCTADEEVGFRGAKKLVAESAWYRDLVTAQPLAIIGEPTSCRVVHAHKGIYGFRLISRGRAAHSSTRAGLNANLAMVPMLVELLRLYERSESDPALQDPRFDPPTLSWNFGVSDAATAMNIVPARSEAWVSLRTMPTIDGAELVRSAKQKAAELGLEFRMEKGGGYVWIDPAAPFLKKLCELADCPYPETVCYGTDGGELTELNSMVICGPGEIAQAHTADEYISMHQFNRGIALYGQILQHWCQ